jgi:hypothetical protein
MRGRNCKRVPSFDSLAILLLGGFSLLLDGLVLFLDGFLLFLAWRVGFLEQFARFWNGGSLF